MTISKTLDLLGLHLLQSLQGILGVSLLPDADNGVQNKDKKNDKGFYEGGDAALGSVLHEGKDEGNHGRGEQDLHEKVIELLKNQTAKRFGLFVTKLVESVSVETSLGFDAAQTILPARVEELQAFICL